VDWQGYFAQSFSEIYVVLTNLNVWPVAQLELIYVLDYVVVAKECQRLFVLVSRQAYTIQWELWPMSLALLLVWPMYIFVLV